MLHFADVVAGVSHAELRDCRNQHKVLYCLCGISWPLPDLGSFLGSPFYCYCWLTWFAFSSEQSTESKAT